MFKPNCYYQHDRRGRAIISWFWLNTHVVLVVTSQHSTCYGVPHFQTAFIIDDVLVVYNKDVACFEPRHIFLSKYGDIVVDSAGAWPEIRLAFCFENRRN